MSLDWLAVFAGVGEHFLSEASYVWVIIFLILTGCGLPIPEEVGIIAAGVWASNGNMDPWLGLAACIVGCIVGDSIMYGIGYHFGKNVLREHPIFTGFLTPEREKRIEQLIRRRGPIVLFTARFLVGVRSPVYLTAGILHFSYWRFLLIDLFCATVVVSVFFGVAYYFGADLASWFRQAEQGLTIFLALVAVAVGAFFWFHHLRSKKVLEALPEEVFETTTIEEAEAAEAESSRSEVDHQREANGAARQDSPSDEVPSSRV